MSLASTLFSPESTQGPFQYGIRRRSGTSSRATLPLAEWQLQAVSRTHLIHRPARDIIPSHDGTGSSLLELSRTALTPDRLSRSPSALRSDVPARFKNSKTVGAIFGADATKAPVGRDRSNGWHLKMRGCHDAYRAVRGGSGHADSDHQMVLAQGLRPQDRGMKRAVVAVATSFVFHSKLVPSTHIRCMMTAIRRATAVG